MGPTPGLPGGGPVQLSLQGRTRMGRVGGAFSQVGATEGQGLGVRAAQLALETLGPRACGRNDLVLGEFHSVPGLARATLRPRSGQGETASYRWTQGLQSTAGRAWSR